MEKLLILLGMLLLVVGFFLMGSYFQSVDCNAYGKCVGMESWLLFLYNSNAFIQLPFIGLMTVILVSGGAVIIIGFADEIERGNNAKKY